jgi:hypothetical protein
MTGTIYYNGIGCKDGFLHTNIEFLRIMNVNFPHKVYVRRNGDPKGCPIGKLRINDIEGWMSFANAYRTKTKKYNEEHHIFADQSLVLADT